jgi:hypothetical protein
MNVVLVLTDSTASPNRHLPGAVVAIPLARRIRPAAR